MGRQCLVEDAMAERIYQFLCGFAAERDISIVYLPLRYVAKCDSLFILKDNAIFIDKDLPWVKKCFVLVHELGHYVLHRKEMESGQWAAYRENEDFRTKKELEADRFAESLIDVLSRVTDSDLDFLEDVATYIVTWSPETCQRVM
ncbi:MAG: ImmA/IrrE family metallo-endopeptidase, partial [Firmicutes bacterium]|nr:ImmA/IrrE family metallo-endopeptidase [Bacillota bacterium]